MKRFTLFIPLLMLCMTVMGSVAPDQLREYGNMFTDLNSRFFGQQDFTGNLTGPSPIDFQMECNRDDGFKFSVKWVNINPGNKVDYVLKIFKVPFAHLCAIETAGSFTYFYPNQAYPDGFDHGQKVAVYDSGTQSNVINNGGYFDLDVNLTIEPGFAYYAEVNARNGGLIPGSWMSHHSGSINFIVGDDVFVDGVLSNVVGTVAENSFYGTTDIDIIDGCGITLDASGSTCENTYRYNIEAFDLMNWQIDGSQPSFQSGWIPGEAPVLDLAANYNFVHGQVYHVSLAVGPVWDVQDYFFRFQNITVDFELNHHSIRTISVPQPVGPAATFDIHQICSNDPNFYLSSDGTVNECSYSVAVREVNGALAPVPFTTVTTTGGQVPAFIDLYNLYNNQYQSGQIYEVILTANAPAVSKSMYFEFGFCRLKANLSDESAVEGMVSLEAFPNPAVDGRFQVTMPDGNFEVTVYSVVGKAVRTYKGVGNSALQIDLSDQPSGVYLLRYANEGTTGSMKLIKP